ncbi:putative addiction module antidote protein [Xylophilus rhododendri]|uniref:Putative addiction module antidote protein n=1 Tax=Xylophilus rhododendri TaxID=2697032 RepID=A0A857J0P5_9BURK|nr:addiction module antidote protein [Xylophilus rhododendri]QHI97167.1 putative addiction module antidote protein [Xylophilus rhododendri]
MELKEFDIADYLDSPEVIAEYLSQILEDGDPAELVDALGDVARATGMSHIAELTGLGRESLYKTFKEGTQPRFDTVVKVLKAAGLQLTIVPARHARASGGSSQGLG